jgi:uncharacterized membrane protein YdjX (TVP38/TMEM64 family)
MESIGGRNLMRNGSGIPAGRIKAVKIGLAVLSALLLALLIWYLYRYADPALLLVQQDNQLTMALILLGFFVFKALTVVLVESTLLYVAAAVFFPLEQALFIVFIGISIEISIEFALGRLFGRKRVQALLHRLQGRKPLLDRMLARLQGSDPVLIMMLRLLPGFHNGITGLALGASGTSILVYFPASLLGMLPKAIASTLMGRAVLDPLSWRFLLPLGLYLIAVGLALLMRRLMKKRMALNGNHAAEEKTEETVPPAL